MLLEFKQGYPYADTRLVHALLVACRLARAEEGEEDSPLLGLASFPVPRLFTEKRKSQGLVSNGI